MARLFRFYDQNRNDLTAKTLIEIARTHDDTIEDLLQVCGDHKGWIVKRGDKWVPESVMVHAMSIRSDDNKLIKSWKRALRQARKEKEDATNC